MKETKLKTIIRSLIPRLAKKGIVTGSKQSISYFKRYEFYFMYFLLQTLLWSDYWENSGFSRSTNFMLTVQLNVYFVLLFANVNGTYSH